MKCYWLKISAGIFLRVGILSSADRMHVKYTYM